jgi:hypothetical protein
LANLFRRTRSRQDKILGMKWVSIRVLIKEDATSRMISFYYGVCPL